jgi:hypothetical protein
MPTKQQQNPQQSALAGLARATATDPNDTSQAALLARERERNDDGVSIGSQSFTHQQWAPYFESMTEAGERQGGTFGGVKSAPGLPADNNVADSPYWWLSDERPAQDYAGYQRLLDKVPQALRGLMQWMNPNKKQQQEPPRQITGVRG